MIPQQAGMHNAQGKTNSVIFQLEYRTEQITLQLSSHNDKLTYKLHFYRATLLWRYMRCLFVCPFVVIRRY